jgi:predicted  nucleic acid-binding Zn-ribbon protein
MQFLMARLEGDTVPGGAATAAGEQQQTDVQSLTEQLHSAHSELAAARAQLVAVEADLQGSRAAMAALEAAGTGQQQGAAAESPGAHSRGNADAHGTDAALDPAGVDRAGLVPAEVHAALQAKMEKAREQFAKLKAANAANQARASVLEQQLLEVRADRDAVWEQLEALQQQQQQQQQQGHEQQQQPAPVPVAEAAVAPPEQQGGDTVPAEVHAALAAKMEKAKEQFAKLKAANEANKARAASLEAQVLDLQQQLTQQTQQQQQQAGAGAGVATGAEQAAAGVIAQDALLSSMTALQDALAEKQQALAAADDIQQQLTAAQQQQQQEHQDQMSTVTAQLAELSELLAARETQLLGEAEAGTQLQVQVRTTPQT